MKVIILAGGYGVRLQEDIQKLEKTNEKEFEYFRKFLGIPKPLLPLNNRPLLDYIIDEIKDAGIKEVLIRANEKNYEEFVEWKKKYGERLRIEIFNDGSSENKHGLGVFGGVLFIIEKKKIDEAVLILAGDTLFDYSLKKVLQEYERRRKTLIVAHKERPEFIKLRGVIEYDEHKKIRSYEEKPANPKSMYAATPTFIFDASCTRLIKEYTQETKNDQNMGSIVTWFLQKNKEAYTYITEKEIIDIGSVEGIKLAERFLRDRKKSIIGA